jgi:plastocyanin
MPSRRKIACAAVLAAALAAVAAAPAAADVTTRTYTTGPFDIGGYQVRQAITAGIPKPTDDGAITAMDVDVVDPRTGEQVPINRIMLHHIVFTRIGNARANLLGQAFYGAGEERATMSLPPGYGYPVRGDDQWAIIWMLMNHRADDDSVLIRYHVTYDTDPGLRPVQPMGFDASHGRQGLVYDVPGDRARGAIDTRTAYNYAPFNGRIVAGLGHVHGGARDLALSQPDCGDRVVYDSRPTWGMPNHPFYNVRPVLHEPGPIDMSRFRSAEGIPVTAGQQLKLSSNYYNDTPHVRAMGLMLVYVAPDPTIVDGCGALPDDVETLRTTTPGRPKAPAFHVPITAPGRDGIARTIKAPPGRMRVLHGGANVTVGDLFFSRRNLSVPRGATITWTAPGPTHHDVTLANGPYGFSSDRLHDGRQFSQQLTKPGRYQLFCSLHPTQMNEQIVVRR